MRAERREIHPTESRYEGFMIPLGFCERGAIFMSWIGGTSVWGGG